MSSYPVLYLGKVDQPPFRAHSLNLYKGPKVSHALDDALVARVYGKGLKVPPSAPTTTAPASPTLRPRLLTIAPDVPRLPTVVALALLPRLPPPPPSVVSPPSVTPPPASVLPAPAVDRPVAPILWRAPEAARGPRPRPRIPPPSSASPLASRGRPPPPLPPRAPAPSPGRGAAAAAAGGPGPGVAPPSPRR